MLCKQELKEIVQFVPNEIKKIKDIKRHTIMIFALTNEESW